MRKFAFHLNELSCLRAPGSSILAQSFGYLHMLGIALAFDGIGMVLAAVLRVYNFATAVMLVSLLMNVITLCGNAIALFVWLGLPNYGLYGVAVSTVVGRLVGENWHCQTDLH